jgi:hypothetical protein
VRFAIVEVKALFGIRWDFAWSQRSGSREVDVHVAIIVGIDHRGTARDLFNEVVLTAATKVLDKVKAGGLRGIFKTHIGHGARCGCYCILNLYRLRFVTSNGGKQSHPKDEGRAKAFVVHR